ncbi:MAG: DUF89 family protein [Acutalibacter sp.]|nr:DUF89 family protein [Acutalibacter sp.]
MRANSMCISCIVGRQEKMIRSFHDEEKKSEYMHQVLKIMYEHGRSKPSPWLVEQINKVYEAFWGSADYGLLKRRYNQLLLDREKEIEEAIRKTDDTVRECIKYVCAGNYIDFSAVENVSEETLKKLLDKAAQEPVSETEYAHFVDDLSAAHTLVYFTDNCGEIVLDKLFLRFLKERFPDLRITVIVRGKDVINDATLQDAREIGLTELVPCIGNGNGAPGTVPELLNEEAKKLLSEADVVISKGQGNFEGMFGEGVNPYYFFLCKCSLFVERFGLPQYESVFMKEERIQTLLAKK